MGHLADLVLMVGGGHGYVLVAAGQLCHGAGHRLDRRGDTAADDKGGGQADQQRYRGDDLGEQDGLRHRRDGLRSQLVLFRLDRQLEFLDRRGDPRTDVVKRILDDMVALNDRRMSFLERRVVGGEVVDDALGEIAPLTVLKAAQKLRGIGFERVDFSLDALEGRFLVCLQEPVYVQPRQQ